MASFLKIETLEGLKENIKKCDEELEKIHALNSHILPYVRAWCILEEEGEYFIGFSKFVGFKGLNANKYVENYETNYGRDSNKSVFRLYNISNFKEEKKNLTLNKDSFDKANNKKLDLNKINIIRRELDNRLTKLGKKRGTLSYIIFVKNNNVYWNIENKKIAEENFIKENALIDIDDEDFTNDNLKSTKTEKSERKSKTVQNSNEHNKIQNAVFLYLRKKYEKSNVGIERYGIDILRKTKDSKIAIYEIKSFNDFRSIVREALGQIIEYGYYRGFKREVAQLIIVGGASLDEIDKKYWKKIKENIKFPIFYQKWNGKELEKEL